MYGLVTWYSGGISWMAAQAVRPSPIRSGPLASICRFPAKGSGYLDGTSVLFVDICCDLWLCAHGRLNSGHDGDISLRGRKGHSVACISGVGLFSFY